MLTRTFVTTAICSLLASIAFGQTGYSRPTSPTPTPMPTPKPEIGSVQFQPQSNRQWPTAAPAAATTQVPARSVQSTPVAKSARTTAQFPTTSPPQSNPTTTRVPPPDVKAYLDRQVASSNDQKFHLTVNGKDLALVPFHVWAQKTTGVDSTSTCIDMRSADGRVYDIDFLTTRDQVTGIRIHKINGEALR